MDWETFKDIQLSYLRASVIDIEVPTDNFIYVPCIDLREKIKSNTSSMDLIVLQS